MCYRPKKVTLEGRNKTAVLRVSDREALKAKFQVRLEFHQFQRIPSTELCSLTENLKNKSLHMVSTLKKKYSPGLRGLGRTGPTERSRSDTALGMSNWNGHVCLWIREDVDFCWWCPSLPPREGNHNLQASLGSTFREKSEAKKAVTTKNQERLHRHLAQRHVFRFSITS